LRGIAAEAIEIPAGKSEGILTIRFDREFRGRGNVPLLLRATVIDKGQPVIAEAKVEVR
jgi:hypothetical protein